MANLWTSGTKKAFYGFLTANVVAVILSAFGMAIGVVPFLGTLLDLVVLAAYVFFILGIVAMKNSAAGTSVEAATKRLFIGAILLAVGALVEVLPVISMISWIVTLAAFIVMWTGYAMLKNDAADEKAKYAGNKLALSALLSAIAAVVDFIPVIGWIAEPVLLVIAFIFAFQGWKALSNSELK